MKIFKKALFCASSFVIAVITMAIPTLAAYEESNQTYYEMDIRVNDKIQSTSFKVDEFSTGPNEVIVWELWMNENKKTTDSEGNFIENPHYVESNIDEKRQVIFGFDVRNSAFNYATGQKDTDGRVVWEHDYDNHHLLRCINSLGSNDVLNFPYLQTNIKQYGTEDDFQLIKSHFFVENGEYLFTRLCDKDAMPGDFTNQEYVVVPKDMITSPFIQDGFTKEALENEWVTLENEEKPYEIYIMRGTSDWCYDNYRTYVDWINARDTNQLLEIVEEPEIEETDALTEETFISDDDVPLSVPNVVEVSTNEPEVDNTKLIKLGILSGVFLLIILIGFVGFKIYQKKNEDYL